VTWRGRMRRLMPYVVALVGGFLLAYLIVAFFVFPAGVLPSDVPVPNVIGLTYNDAVQQLRQKGFSAERGETRYHNAAPRGTVLDQEPPGGAMLPPTIRVSLVVSGGQRFATIPAVIGMSREQAQSSMELAGFELGDVSERPSMQPYGTVLDSRPRPGTQAPMPSPVALVISAGPTTVIVPDVVGRQLADAQLLLRQVGLGVGLVQYANGGNAVADAGAVVVGQSPAAGAQAASGSRVDLTIGGDTP
jgi:eukaryotic-like serine/threonine-protein kinase